MADEIRIKVKTDLLLEASSEARNRISQTKTAFERLNSLVSNSRQFWDSRGGAKGREYYRKEQERIIDFLDEFDQHASDLMTIAGIYSNAETEAVSQTALPSDIII